MTTVIKRDGTPQGWELTKVINAVLKSGTTSKIASDVAVSVEDKVGPWDKVQIEELQDLVEKELMGRDADAAKRYILYRQERAKARAVRKSADTRALADYIQASKYARWREDLGRRETWAESVNRRMWMDIKKFPSLEGEIRSVYETFVLTKRVLPSMRSMQFGGNAIEVNNARMFNCSFSLADRPRFFSELFFLLLAGCGVGYSVQRKHVKKLPELNTIDRSRVYFYTVSDSIEGWAGALEELISSYMTFRIGTYIEFDYSKIRLRGVPLKTGGGRAPGHVPLKQLLEKVRGILEGAQGRQLKPIEVHDICCHVAEGVLAGGIRRSSLIALFSPDDNEMLECKSGDWIKTHPHRMMANNSAVILRGDAAHSKNLFDKLFDCMREYGEPGFFFTSHEDYGCNPCGEIGLNPVDQDTGETGFAFCNLTEVNGALVQSREDFVEAAEAASFLGTLQAAYIDFPYLSRASKAVAKRESLLGVSITGVMGNPLVLHPSNQREASEAAVRENIRVAKLIGINVAARVTTIKPSGTASLLLGSVGAGIHPLHARRYFRRVTANPLEPPFQFFKSVNPHMCIEKKPGGDWVVEFPIQMRDDAVIRDDLTGKGFMDHVFSTYENWVLPGTVKPMSSAGLTHNVSCTVNVRDKEWEEVKEYAWKNRERIASMTFLPWVGDKVYPFAPEEAVVSTADEARWNELVSKYQSVDWSNMHETADGTVFSETPACEGTLCEIRR